MKSSSLNLIKTFTQQLESLSGSRQIAEQEVWWLLEHVTNKKPIEFLQKDGFGLTPEQVDRLQGYITEMLEQRKPLQYIIGKVPFGELEILVESPILIPRPETEEWVLWLITSYAWAKDEPLNILDLCSGSGCIGLQLAKSFRSATIIGVDNNPTAIALANKNKELNRISNITFIESNLYEALNTKEKFDLIVSNPPYLTEKEWEKLDPEVKEWEDRQALVASDNGMAIYRQILADAPAFLNKSNNNIGLPVIVFEIGPAQSDLEKALMGTGFTKYAIYKDLSGKKRWVTIGL